MHDALKQVEKYYFLPNQVQIFDYVTDPDSAQYSGCSFTANNQLIHFRSSKITPTKIGQFVTFYKRIENQPIMPFDDADNFDNFMIYTQTVHHAGIFIFSKNLLLEHGIISKNSIGGKRALRVYPPWDIVDSKQAGVSQIWQCQHFVQFL